MVKKVKNDVSVKDSKIDVKDSKIDAVLEDFKIDGIVRNVVKKEGLKFIDKVKLNLKPTKSFLVSMHFSNGTSKSFIACSNSETFIYKKKIYYLRYENAWFDLSHNMYKLNFFDDFPVPIDRKVIKIGDEKYFTVTPDNLKPLLKMEYVKTLAQSQELNKYLKMAVFISALCLLGVIIVGVLVYNGGKIV